jgi:hypothetical protein
MVLDLDLFESLFRGRDVSLEFLLFIGFQSLALQLLGLRVNFALESPSLL